MEPAPPGGLGPRRWRLRRKHVRRLLIAGVLLLIPAVLLAFCVGPPSYYREKYSPAGTARPLAAAHELVPEMQVEPHTCGLHSLSSIYCAYGLDPVALRLRFRLGVDKPFTNLMPDSLGTIHPDMLRVLGQDGFDTTLVNPRSEGAPARLRSHLDAGHVAVALIRVNELHWVVLGSRGGESLVVCDSLRERTYEEPLEPYLRERVYSLLLIEPAMK